MCMRREISEGKTRARVVEIPSFVKQAGPRRVYVEVLTDAEACEIRNERLRALDEMARAMKVRLVPAALARLGVMTTRT